MIKKIFDIKYHPELVKMMLDGIRLNIIMGNLIMPMATVFVLKDFISFSILSIWLICHILILIIRMVLAKKITYTLKKRPAFVNIYLKIYLYITAINGALWGLIALMSVYYTPAIYVFIMIAIILGLVSGSVATLGSIFHAFTIYLIFATYPFIFALLLSDDITYIISAVMIIFYTIIIMKSNSRYYLALKKSILLQEEVQRLNSSLETKVQLATLEIELKNKAMLQQSRLAQMGEMISMIAHQWRQPLTAISATSASMNLKATMNTLDKETSIKLTNKISEYAQHLSKTINDFRNFFKDNNEEKESTTFEKIVSDTLDIVQISLENENIKVQTIFKESTTLNTYASEVKQVVLNIIKNAEDALIERNIELPQIIIEVKGSTLSISDNAGGIPEDILNKIFNPYFSTKKQKDGTGLGLYMSKTIIEDHCQGKLEVENSERGARFTLTL